jgi:hypothetical protein
MESCVNTYHDFEERFQREPQFLSKITIGSETWGCGYDPETNDSIIIQAKAVGST